MNVHLLRRRPFVACALIFGFWTLLGLVDVGQLCYHRVTAGVPIVWWRVLSTGLVDWYIWALLTPLVLVFAHVWPIRGRSWHWCALIHLAISVSLAFLVINLCALILPFTAALRPDVTFYSAWWNVFSYKLHLYVLLYWLVIGAAHLMDAVRISRERALKASQLEARLAQSQLQVLKMQLHPHFLFNTLNAISALIHHDVDAADRMLARLGELLRLTLENAGTQEVSLRRELELINPYLEIQQSRLGNRLVVRMDIDPDVMDARVPNLVLQPLVENAIQHGIAPRPGGGRVEVSARRFGDKLRLVVRDEGPPYPNGAATGEAVELSTTRSRLQQMYGSGHTFTLEEGPRHSHVLTLELPFQGGEPISPSPEN